MSAKNKKLYIKCEEDPTNDPHPHCPHGPTILFYNEKEGSEQGYFACSANRDKRSCTFYLPKAELTAKKLCRRHEHPLQFYRSQRRKVFAQLTAKEITEQSLHFCLNCNVPLLSNEIMSHTDHEILRNLTSQLLQHPTQFLRPFDNDKMQAQYFFDERALKFFTKCFQILQISKVICIGAPRLHAHLHTNNHCIKSFLLDFDNRFYYFYKDDYFAWYNMCNNYFFDLQQMEKFKDFIKKKTANDQMLIFVDPPFGCRTEIIAHTLRQLVQLNNAVNESLHHPVPIFWIFPYFAEHYVRQQMPELQMCDYKVNYTNHTTYTNLGEKCRKLGSPVRLFTNVPLDRLTLPIEEGYKYCATCVRYTALENQHCVKCHTCPSKNGATYQHCELCGTCIKPSYVHCDACRRCVQLENHNCYEYQTQQRCWICRELGHIERNCKAWDRKSKRKIQFRSLTDNIKIINCLLCGHCGHNERNCKQRNKYIKEQSFLGELQVTFI